MKVTFITNKSWQEIEKQVEENMLNRFSAVPKSERVKLGIEPGTSFFSHENRQWVQTYVQMLAWKNKCKELHEQLLESTED